MRCGQLTWERSRSKYFVIHENVFLVSSTIITTIPCVWWHMMTMLGGDLYLHSWGLYMQQPNMVLDFRVIMANFLIFSLNSRHRLTISVLLWCSSSFFLLYSILDPAWLSKSLRLWRNQANHRHWHQWSQRVAVDANHLRRGWWKSWCCEENGNEKLIMCHARWKMQHENASKHVVTVSVAICSLIYKCVCIYIYHIAIYGGFLEYLE